MQLDARLHRAATSLLRARRARRQLLAEWLPSLRGAPQRAHGSQAASDIGSDLVPTWTGQAAAHGGHAGLAEVGRVFSTFVNHILVGRAYSIDL